MPTQIKTRIDDLRLIKINKNPGQKNEPPKPAQKGAPNTVPSYEYPEDEEHKKPMEQEQSQGGEDIEVEQHPAPEGDKKDGGKEDGKKGDKEGGDQNPQDGKGDKKGGQTPGDSPGQGEVGHGDQPGWGNMEGEGEGQGQGQGKGGKSQGGKSGMPSSGDEEFDKLFDVYDNSATSEIDARRDKDLEEAGKAGQGDGEGAGKGQGKGDGKGKGEGEFGGPEDVSQEEVEGGSNPKTKSWGQGKGSAPIQLRNTPGNIQVTGEETMPGPITPAQMDVFKQKLAENRHRAINHPDVRMRPSALRKPKHRQSDKDSGYGLMGEFGAVGYTPPQTGIWKKVFKKWIASILEEKSGPSWFRSDLRTSVIRRQLDTMGSHAKLKNQDVPAARNTKHRIFALVDVSGSVFDMNIQSEFAKILRGVPKDKAEVLIWTFDAGIQQGPFTPSKYNPTRGGGGTSAANALEEILTDPRYQRPDGIVFLTDGCFSIVKPAGISAKQMCFILTKKHEKSSIPAGSKIIDTSIEEGGPE